MDMLQLLAAAVFGVIITLAWQTYAWPVIQKKRAIKARTAKAVATRKRNAAAKATGEPS